MKAETGAPAGRAAADGAALFGCVLPEGRFEDRRERWLCGLRERAAALAERLAAPPLPRAYYAQLVARYEEETRQEWGALFGAATERVYVLADMDSFFASVEMLENPALQAVPVAVGSVQMIAACNYAARAYGVRAGLPGYRAQQLCPGLQIVAPCFERYKAYSRRVMAILRRFDPDLDVASIDEACLIFDFRKYREAVEQLIRACKAGNPASESSQCDLDSSAFTIENVAKLINKIRQIIKEETGLTISAGISVCRGLAKLASHKNKPDGQFLIADDFDSHILHLPVGKINGIGRATVEMLHSALEIKTVADLRRRLKDCAIIFTSRTLRSLVRLSYGLSHFDETPWARPARAALSHSISRTLKAPDWRAVMDLLWAYATTLLERVEREERQATIVTLTIKYSSFDTVSRQKKGGPYTTAVMIFNAAVELMDSLFPRTEHARWDFKRALHGAGTAAPGEAGGGIRLVGLALSGLGPRLSKSILDFKALSPAAVPVTCPVCLDVLWNTGPAGAAVHVSACLDRQGAQRNAPPIKKKGRPLDKFLINLTDKNGPAN